MNSLSNTKKQSTSPVQKPTANEDNGPDSTDQTLASFEKRWVSPHPREVCFQSQREGDVLSILCVRLFVCLCAGMCVCKRDIITHRSETTVIHSCDSGRGGEPKMTSQSSFLRIGEVLGLVSLVTQPHLHSQRHGNHPDGCSSPWCGISLSPS